jgi:hypothetical protein
LRFCFGVWAAFLLGGVPAFGAGGFNYANRDMLMGFRQTGGSYEMVVDLGAATNFYHFTPGSATPITNFSQSTLNYAFSDFGNLSWAVFSSVLGGQGDANQPDSTLWATEARTDTNVHTSPLPEYPDSFQGTTAQYMASVGRNAYTYANTLRPDGLTDTPTALLIQAGNSLGYSAQIGPGGDFNGTFFGGDVENTTSDDFGSEPSCVVSDLYELQPSDDFGDPGVYRGFFTFNWNGTMTYTAAYSAPPVLTRISPSTGVFAGGTTVTLTGSGFINGKIVVEFGGVLATDVQFVNSTTVTAVAPAAALGVTDVLVANSDGQSSDLAAAYTYGAAATPVPGISSLTRSGGNLVIVSSNTASSSLTLYTCTNLAAPFASWTPLNTNSVGTAGMWTNTISISPTDRHRYFILAVP